MVAELRKALIATRAFHAEASRLLGSNEQSITSRAYNAHDALQAVGRLKLSQSDLLKQAIRCVESELYRAAFVMAWTPVADLLLELAVKESALVLAKRTRWSYTDKTSLSETVGDHAIIEALKEVSILTKGEMKSLHGLLHRRNECAHPSSYFPGPNEALGYIDEAMKFCTLLNSKI